MTPDAWSADADALLRSVLAKIARCDPAARARIQAALDDGGRLKVVIDRPDRVWRLRVRLVHRPDSPAENYWVWQQWEPWRPLAAVG